MPSVRPATLLAAIAAISLMGATCGGPDETPTVTPTPTPTPTATPLVGLHAPVAAGQTLTVYNGYDHPLPDVPCPTPGTAPLDHCGNQEYGLDLIPSRLADPRILAPAGGAVGWTSSGAMACLGIIPNGTTLNLTVCHFAAGEIFVQPGDAAVAGQVLGLRDPNAWWVHLSLDDRAGSRPYPPVPFDGLNAIEGVAFPARVPPVSNLYCGLSFGSTNTVPAGDAHVTQPDYGTYAAAPALGCSAAQASPSSTPTRTSSASPSPTPPPTPKPTPKPTPRPTPAPLTWSLTLKIGYVDAVKYAVAVNVRATPSRTGSHAYPFTDWIVVAHALTPDPTGHWPEYANLPCEGESLEATSGGSYTCSFSLTLNWDTHVTFQSVATLKSGETIKSKTLGIDYRQ